MSRNGRDDLAIGIPGGVINGHDRAGAESVLSGRGGGLSSADSLWSQDARGIDGIAEPRDMFGSALAAADFSRNGADDLAIGVPGQRIGGDVERAPSMSSTATAATGGIKGAIGNDQFGAALSSGRSG